jgi:ATP-dependent DNA helicase RecG
MALPINIKELVHGKVVEWERLEFKKGWNPEDVLYSICAFANDFNNWGGGYIFIGIDEVNGKPVLPPKGLEEEQADAIQKKLRELSRKIDPFYFPVVQPELIEGQLVLILWVPSGDRRPYSAPISLAEKKSERAYYIRENSSSVPARDVKLTELLRQSSYLPFDECVNTEATLADLDLGLIRTHLQKTGSRLFEESDSMPFTDLCRNFKIANGPVENFRPLNLALLLFSQEPDKWFPGTRIELVIHNPFKPKEYEEQIFKGPVQFQLTTALNVIKEKVVRQKVVKLEGQAESLKISNFPFEAIEEALANAIFHKDYTLHKPVEIQVWPNSEITILSFPGPLPPIDNTDLQKERIIARDYRNRRLGDFLKELHLTEGRATGVPLIHQSLRLNGSPDAVLYTDKQRTVFLVTLKVHKAFENEPVVSPVHEFTLDNWEDLVAFINQVVGEVSSKSGAQDNAQDGAQDNAQDSPQVNAQVNAQVSAQVNAQVNAQVSAQVSSVLSAIGINVEKTRKALESVEMQPLTRQAILSKLGLLNHYGSYLAYISPLIEKGFLENTASRKRSRNQQYKITLKGLVLLKILEVHLHDES